MKISMGEDPVCYRNGTAENGRVPGIERRGHNSWPLIKEEETGFGIVDSRAGINDKSSLA